MDEEWKQTVDDLSRVWPRVNPMGPPPPPPEPGQRPRPDTPPPPPRPDREDAETLAELIRGEAGLERQYSALARRTDRRAAATLRQLAMGSRRTVRRLQTEYQLRTGDTLSVPRERPGDQNFSAALRKVWRDAGTMENAYRAAAGRTRDPDLRTLYGDAAQQKQRQRAVLRGLMGRLAG